VTKRATSSKRRTPAVQTRQVTDLKQKESELQKRVNRLELMLRQSNQKLKQSQSAEKIALSRVDALQTIIQQQKRDIQGLKRDIASQSSRQGGSKEQERLKRELGYANRKIAAQANELERLRRKPPGTSVGNTKILSGAERQFLSQQDMAGPRSANRTRHADTSVLSSSSSESSDEQTSGIGAFSLGLSERIGSSVRSEPLLSATERYEKLKQHYVHKYH